MHRYGSIYVVTNIATNEQYVGQTRQKVRRRWKCHINTANSKIAPKYKLAAAILEHGPAVFDFQEVFVSFDAYSLNAAEMQFIEDLRPAYNTTKGGAGHRGVVTRPEVRQARSERLKRQWTDPEWRMRQLENIQKTAATQEARERGKKVAAIGNAARWAGHVKKERPAPQPKRTRIKRDPMVGRFLAAKAKWKPVYCPQLQCSFLSQKAAAEFLGVLTTSVANAVKQKGRVRGMYTLEKVA